MAEGDDQREQNSVQDISNLLDELVDAHHEVEAARVQEEAFRSTHEQLAVAPNTSFPNIEELVKYNEQRAHVYDTELKQVRGHLQEKNRWYREVAELVVQVLPVGSSVHHAYGGGNEEHAGHYRVSHPQTGNVVVGRIGPP